jgi:hypothetical protein
VNAQAASPAQLRWLEARAGCLLTPGARGVAAVDDKGHTRGVVAYDCWTESAAQAHMAVDTPMAWRALLPHVFTYPFLSAGKRLLLGIIPASNRRSVAMTKRLGFSEAYRVRDGWAAGDDLVVFEMRREECRYLESEAHG